MAKQGYHKTPQRKAQVKLYNASPKGRYQAHKLNSRMRGIEFSLTFDEWWSLWAGKWELRGKGGGKYHMCRNGDAGGYTLGNVYVATSEQNHNDISRKIGCAGHKLPNDAIDRIITLHKDGLTFVAIAKLIGCTEMTAAKYTKMSDPYAVLPHGTRSNQ